jgi:4-amino-4-deoxy-L-arabinose transferase-like glycosyltransferase
VASTRATQSGTSGTLSAYLPPWLARIPPHLRVLAVILIVGLLLRLWPITGISADYDEGVYWQSLRAMAAGQPLYTAVFSSQPPFFLLGLYPFYQVFGQSLVAARFGVVVYSLAGVLGLYAAGRMIGGRWAGVVAAALLAFEPLYVTESRTLQAEVPSLAFQIVCVALAVAAGRAAGRQRLVLAALSGVALGLGVLTKLSDIVALFPALLYLIPWAEPAPGNTLPAAFRRALPALGALALGVGVAFVLVLAPFVGHLDLVYDQAVRFHFAAAQAVNRGLSYNVTFLLRTGELYPLWLLAILALILALRRRSWVVLPPLVWLLATLLLLLDQQPLFDHHRTLLSAPLALLAALCVPLALQSSASGPLHFARVTPPAAPRGVLVGLVSLALLVGLGLNLRAGHTASRPPDALQTQMASALERFSLPGELVASDDQYVAGLADRSVLPQLVDTSMVRIESGYLTTAQVEALLTQNDTSVVLFASNRFDLLPGFRAWVASRYTVVTTFPNGGALYLKGSPGPPIA